MPYRSLSHRARTLLLLVCAALLFSIPLALSHRLRQSAALSAAATLPAYTARIYDGRVALYRTGARLPYEVTDIPADQLPEADRAALTRGIPLADEEALAHLLEDYF